MRTLWILPLFVLGCRTKDLADSGCLLQTFYADLDGDGYGADEVEACFLEAPYVQAGGDCDDQDASVNPGAVEACNSIDDNCDGVIDENLTGTFYVDEDGDGYGTTAIEGCDGAGAAEGGDCDDENPDIHPGAVEVCDTVDNDCDTLVDDDDDSLDQGSAERVFADLDGDGYGDLQNFDFQCALQDGYVDNDEDCDDAEISVNPGATEVCDGVDTDCDGALPEDEADLDGDGYVVCIPLTWLGSAIQGGEDCDDEDATSWPGAEEWCDGVDHDCDGEVYDDDAVDQWTWYRDLDGDGDGDPAATTTACLEPSDYVGLDTDCDDTDDTVYDGAAELCDGQDNDCDGSIPADEADDDSDQYIECVLDGGGWDGAGTVVGGEDCDDGDGDVNPGATEVCDGDDEDCDGVADNGVLGSGSACAADDCLEILNDQPSASDGSYTLTAGTYECDMSTDGGGWTKVGNNHPVYGTGWNSSSYNSEGFTFDEIFFEYDSGSTHGHCTYPGSMTGCVPWGFRYNGGGSWYGPQNWGSSTCGMGVSNTFRSSTGTTLSGQDVFIHHADVTGSSSTASIQVGMLEGISGCTTGDNYGTAYMDIWLR